MGQSDKNRLEFTKKMRFKQQFKQLNYYSMPTSILFVVRKRLNLLGYFALFISILLYTLF